MRGWWNTNNSMNVSSIITITCCEEAAKKLLEHFYGWNRGVWTHIIWHPLSASLDRLSASLPSNSRTFQDQTHFPGLPSSWKFYKHNPRLSGIFQEACVPSNMHRKIGEVWTCGSWDAPNHPQSTLCICDISVVSNLSGRRANWTIFKEVVGQINQLCPLDGLACPTSIPAETAAVSGWNQKQTAQSVHLQQWQEGKLKFWTIVWTTFCPKWLWQKSDRDRCQRLFSCLWIADHWHIWQLSIKF